MKRRGRGEGSIYERPDRTWVAALSLGKGGNGKRKRRVIYAATKKEVQERLRRLQFDADRGRLVDPCRQPLSEFMDLWLADVKATVQASTHAYYQKHVEHHLKPTLGNTRLDKISPLIVRGLYTQLAAKGVSATNANKIGITLGVALGHAVQLGLIAHNPARDVKKPRAPRYEATIWTAQQLRQFLASVRGGRNYALFLLAAETGMRQGELFGLLWRDLDWDGRAVNVCRSLAQVGREFTIKEPKTAAGRRRIPLSAAALAALNEHRKAMLAGGFYAADRVVFCSPMGGYIDKANFYHQVYAPAVARAGVPDARFHDIRHAAATLLLQAGVDLATVSSRLGHGSKATTVGFYAHATETGQTKATATMESLLTGTGN